MIRLMIAAIAGATAAMASLSAQDVHAEELSRIAVVVGPRLGIDAQPAGALADTLARELQRAFVLEAVSSDYVSERGPAELSADCLADQTCRIDTARRLVVDGMLVLVLVSLGDGVQIDPTWIDGRTGRAVSREVIEIAADDDLVAVLAARAPALLPNARPRPAPTPGAPAESVELRLPRFQPIPRVMTPFSWTMAGVGGAALTGGVIAALAARGVRDDLRRRGCQIKQCSDTDVNPLRTRTLIADALFAVALAAAATTVTLYLRSGGGYRLIVPDLAGETAAATTGVIPALGVAGEF